MQFVPSLWQGGAELVAVNLAFALKDRVGKLVFASSGGEPYTQRLRDGGIELVIVPRPKPRLIPIIRSARALARVLRRERPHVIHAHNPGASAAAWLARRLARTPGTAIVTTYHGVVPARVGHANRALAWFSDLVVGVGPTATETLVARGLPAESTRTIFNAVDPEIHRSRDELRAEFGVPDGVPLVVNVGRYVEQKNQALLLEALAKLERPFKALVVGYGELEQTLRDRTASLGLADRVIVTGERDDAADLIAAGDVFVMSSDWEALPLVVLEALVLGTPVVATRAGAVADVVQTGNSGLLVERGDADALASAIAQVLDDPQLAQRLTEGGLEFARDSCSVTRMADAYAVAYADALARRAGAKPST